MQKLIHKNFEIYKIEDASKLGDYTAKFFHIKNQNTNNTFFYTVKISGTVQAIEQINNEKKFIDTALPYVTKALDKSIENSNHSILVTTYTQEEKKKSGIFYTPEEVIRFIFDILNIWKQKEDKKTGRWSSRRHFPSVIDPAVGEGAFLKIACETDFTQPDWVFGLDIDENVVKKWREINLLEEFGGKNKDLEAHFFHQNGLEPIKWDQHKGKYKYKLKQIDIQNQQFDAVVGNPPYGGVGLQEITPDLESALFDFEIWKSATKKQTGKITDQLGLLGTTLVKRDREKLTRFPIEILFVDRFIQLAKDGGYITIIIPDGILTNSNSDYVREFLSRKTKIEAIVSLPRNTFKNVGTSAKTSILFLRKLKPNEKIEQDYPVFLSSLESINSYNFQRVADAYQKFYNKKEKNMDKSQLVQITKDQNKREAVMVRADKTLKELMEEEPFSRLDVNYWHPKWDAIIQDFKASKTKKKYLYEFFSDNDWLIATDHVRASRDETEGPGLPIEYYSPAGFLFTGYNTSNIPRCSENAFRRMQRARPLKEDVLLGGFGMGPTGKSLIVWHDPSEMAIVGNIFILRVKTSYSPYVLDVFFKSKYGRAQFSKYKTGVAFYSLSNDEIRYLLVPDFPNQTKKSIEYKYKDVIKAHDLAMQANKRSDKRGYKDNLETAEKMLKDLIKRTEKVIEGKREDIN